MIAEVAETLDVPFVLADSAGPAALSDAPRFTTDAPSVRAVLGALEATSKLEVWIHEGAMVWYGVGDRPALLGAATRRLVGTPPKGSGNFPPLTGTLDLEAASTAEALSALSAAFGVPVAFVAQLPTSGNRITLQAEDIDLATAAAIVAESIPCRATWSGSAVLMDASAPVVPPIDSGARAADIREARRLAQPSERQADDAGIPADRQP